MARIDDIPPEKWDELKLELEAKLGKVEIGKFAFRLGATFCAIVMGILVLMYDSSFWVGMLFELVAMAIGVAIGLVFEIKRIQMLSKAHILEFKNRLK